MDNLENAAIKQSRWAKKRRARQQANKPKSYRYTARMKLQAMFQAGKGSKRSLDKARGGTEEKIYSEETFRTYKKQFRYFAEWLEENKPEVKTFEEAQEHVNEYLQYRIDKGGSAFSLATIKSALVKVFGVSSDTFIKTPERERRAIKRSRKPVESDKHVSEDTRSRLARFTSATGLRRSELTRIESKDLFFKNGKAYLSVTKGTKGGKPRVAEIMGVSPQETKDIVNFIQSKKGKLFPKVHSNHDNHHYRASYAMRLYKHYARYESDIPKADRYIMRKDRAGEVYDKQAMLIVTKNLGHNRINVIAQSYLYQ